MSDKLLISRTQNDIVMLTFNRPEARNALDDELQQLFYAAMQELAADSSIRVLILTGAGNQAFCAGGDITEHATMTTEEDGLKVAQVVGDALSLLENAPFPSIAALNGAAIGGGSEVALACDMRIAAPHTRMGLVQIRLGVTPGWGTGQRLMHLVGYAQAMEMLLTAHIYEADELLARGLVQQIAPDALKAAMQQAQVIAQWSPDAVQAVKRILRFSRFHTYKESHQLERDEFPPLWASQPHLDAVHAFINRKQKP
jgi:enoyl-CoA hydratase